MKTQTHWSSGSIVFGRRPGVTAQGRVVWSLVFEYLKLSKSAFLTPGRMSKVPMCCAFFGFSGGEPVQPKMFSSARNQKNEKKNSKSF